MARRATLTQETLVALGAGKLAKLILDEVQHNAPFKRIIAAALAGAKGSDAVAAIIDRRFAIEELRTSNAAVSRIAPEPIFKAV